MPSLLWKDAFKAKYRLSKDEKTLNWFTTQEEAEAKMNQLCLKPWNSAFVDLEYEPNEFKTVATRFGNKEAIC